jgi:hypothetical protein
MEPMREGEYPSMFEVGKNGVTEITAETENYGDHGIAWFNVHFGEHVLQRMQFRAVAGIRYFAPSEA